jgi:hypothetical protein
MQRNRLQDTFANGKKRTKPKDLPTFINMLVVVKVTIVE